MKLEQHKCEWVYSFIHTFIRKSTCRRADPDPLLWKHHCWNDWKSVKKWIFEVGKDFPDTLYLCHVVCRLKSPIACMVNDHFFPSSIKKCQ